MYMYIVHVCSIKQYIHLYIIRAITYITRGCLYNPLCIFYLQYGQLIALEQQINSKITSPGSGTDIGYWESLLQQLKAHMARVSNPTF